MFTYTFIYKEILYSGWGSLHIEFVIVVIL